MNYLSQSELTALIANNSIMFGSRQRPGVMLTPDGEVVKCIYPRKLFSKSTLFPQAKSFANNSRKLLAKGIVAPAVSDVSCCKSVPVFMVTYPMLPGEELRDICHQGELSVLADFAGYLARLHDLGIYFRAVHLGNILKLDSGGMGLIDIADLSTRNDALPPFVRARNIAHMLNVAEDKAYFIKFGVARFLDLYFAAAKLTDFQTRMLMFRMNIRLDADLKDRLVG